MILLEIGHGFTQSRVGLVTRVIAIAVHRFENHGDVLDLQEDGLVVVEGMLHVFCFTASSF